MSAHLFEVFVWSAQDPCDSRRWPDPEDLSPRSKCPSFIKNLPKDPVEARKWIEEQLRVAKNGLKKDAERYNKLRFEGGAALSTYDINICNSGNMAKALGQALSLKRNHLTYALSQIDEFSKYLNGTLENLEGTEIQLGFSFCGEGKYC